MARITTIRKYVLKTAGIVLAVLLLIVIGLWVFIATFDLEGQRARIENLASQVLARDVRIDGPMHLSGSVFPRVSIENARIANPDWATHPDFLVVNRLEVGDQPFGFVARRIRDSRCRIDWRYRSPSAWTG